MMRRMRERLVRRREKGSCPLCYLAMWMRKRLVRRVLMRRRSRRMSCPLWPLMRRSLGKSPSVVW
jgi:hypothetical protein